MPGGRRTHDYLYGMPSALVVVEVAAALVCIAWLALFSWGWLYRVLIASAFLGLAVLASKLTKIYERNGLAVRIPRVVAVKYPTGLPALLWWLRSGFFAVVGLMLVFGLVPFPASFSHMGIIACVIALFPIGVTHVIGERHFANTGRAVDVYDDARR